MPDSADPGLCAACIHGRLIRSDRGSTFWLCTRSRTDPRFPRYPRLPVRACPGFERGDRGTAPGGPDGSSAASAPDR